MNPKKKLALQASGFKLPTGKPVSELSQKEARTMRRLMKREFDRQKKR
jgi:hypothetical protein